MLTRKRAISGGRQRRGEEDNVPPALRKKGREVDAESQIERQSGSGVAGGERGTNKGDEEEEEEHTSRARKVKIP